MTNCQVRLLDLPLELLEGVVLLLYTDGNETINSIRDLSQACKVFRRITAPILFYVKRLAISTDRSSVQRLLACTNLRWLDYVNTLTLSSESGFTVLTSEHVVQTSRELHRFFALLGGLRTLRLEICHTNPPPGLNILRERKLHIVLNLQNLDVGFDVQKWDPLMAIPNWRWSIFAPKYQRQIVWSKERQPRKLVALKRVVSNELTESKKDNWLRIAKHSPILEELSLIGEQVEITAAEEPALNAQVVTLLQKLPSLQRLRLEGSATAWHLIPELPVLHNLQHLTIYSGWKKAFHRTCVEELPTPTADLPWLSLPNLKYLDIRFICRHFSIQQIVPPGLLGLRIEFFGPNDFLSNSDLQWLAKKCPTLDKLELDIGNFFSSPSTDAEVDEETAERLDCLRSFRHLRILRFFPSYWRDGKMLPHPLPSNHWPVVLFRQLQESLTSLRQLYVCMSYGEYPFDIVPLMDDMFRPVRFRVVKVSEQKHSLLRTYACSSTAAEMTFKHDINSWVVEKQLPTRPDDFFRDLDDSWILPHCDFVGRHPSALMDDDET